MHDGRERYFVTTPGEEIVGVVVQGQELGPIVFTDLFIERFPKLRQVTVVREATHQYVYRAGAPKRPRCRHHRAVTFIARWCCVP